MDFHGMSWRILDVAKAARRARQVRDHLVAQVREMDGAIQQLDAALGALYVERDRLLQAEVEADGAGLRIRSLTSEVADVVDSVVAAERVVAACAVAAACAPGDGAA